MSGGWAHAALAAYRLAGRAAYPLIGPYVDWRASRGKEDPERRRERYGFPGLARPGEGPLVWVHAASVGESVAVAPMVRAIAGFGLPVLMTTGTVTSAAVARERLAGAMVHQYVPLDLKPAVARFLDHWRPALAITAESEIWPTTMMELGRRRIPHLLVNARLSDRSFRRWRSAPALAGALFATFAEVIAQSEADGERFRVLGAPRVAVAGNLKADTAPPPFDAAALAALKAAIGDRSVWAAVSTHAGEEDMAADVHLALKRQGGGGLLTAVVPRHVRRADAIERAFLARGLKVARRSRGALPDAETDILLGDTTGEMGLYLRLTEIAFVGRSLFGEGGQNPLEAAMLGTAILSGPSTGNFRDIYGRLLATGGARLVEDSAALAEIVGRLLADPALRRRMMAGSAEAAAALGGALARTMAALDPFLDPLKHGTGLEASAGPAGAGREEAGTANARGA